MTVVYEIRGQRIEVPQALTDAEIEAIDKDLSLLYPAAPDVPTPENIEAATTAPPFGPQEPTLGQQATEQLPAIGGGLGGMLGFSVGGPTGAIIGAGTGGGTGATIRDIIQDAPFDPMNLIQEGLLQATYEAGGALVVNIGGKIAKYAPDTLRAFGIAQGTDPKIAIAKLMQARAPQAGTPESKQITQQILQEGTPAGNNVVTATLTAGQTGEAGFVRRLTESLGQIGILGSTLFKQNEENVETILNQRLNVILDGIDRRIRGTSEIGEVYFDTINSAKQALTSNYGNQLTGIQAKFRNGTVDTTLLKERAEELLEEAQRASESGRATLIEAPTLQTLRDILDLPDSITGDALLEFQKKQSQKASSMLERGTAGYNTVASAEVTDLVANTIRPFTDGQLNRINPEAFSKLSTLNSNYKLANERLTPAMLKVAAQRGDKGNFTAVGQILVEGRNPDMARAAFDAILEAKRINPKLNVLEATEGLRQGYLQSFIGGPNRDIGHLVKAAQKLREGGRELEMFNTVLGKSADGIKKLLNAASDASEPTQVGFLSLMLRGREATALANVVQVGGAGYLGAEGGTGDLALAAAVLGGPRIFAKLALNPKSVNKLLQLNKASRNMKPQAIYSNLVRIAGEAGIDLEREKARKYREYRESASMAQAVGEVTEQ